jgi:uncharacterized protein with von Willebrand factor type A (vWA) domain
LYINLGETLRSTLRRSASIPFKLDISDFQVYKTRKLTSSATVVAIDTSGSMDGEPLVAARKIALALSCLIEEQFKGDYLGILGFSDYAHEMSVYDVATMHPFGSCSTNFQAALKRAGNMLKQTNAVNKQVILISDMMPTCYNNEPPLSFTSRLENQLKKLESKRDKLDSSQDTDFMFGSMMMSCFGGGCNLRDPSFTAGLYEASRLKQDGINVNLYMVGFHPPVDDIVEVYRKFASGKLFMPETNDLGKTVMYDFLKNSSKRISS